MTNNLEKLVLFDLGPALAAQIRIALQKSVEQREQRLADRGGKRCAFFGIQQAVPDKMVGVLQYYIAQGAKKSGLQTMQSKSKNARTW